METKKRQLHLQLKAWGLPRGDTLRSDPFLVIFQVIFNPASYSITFGTTEEQERGFPLLGADRSENQHAQPSVGRAAY